MRRTKIVCTLGPATESAEMIRELIRSGMDVARINFSHGTQEEHARRIRLVRQIADEERRVVAVMADLQGPKLRVGEIAGGKVLLQAEAQVVLTARPAPGDERQVHFPHPEVIAGLKPDDTILLDDGALELRVLEVDGPDVRCRVVIGGELLPHKGVSVPGGAPHIPAITDKDRDDLAFALERDVDYVAMSFVRQAADVRWLRELMREAGREAPIIAKIEKPEAVKNIEAILEEADGVMVARGDLGVESPPEMVPLAQKRLIKLARQAAKPVITATQMLESMIQSPRPTRAEASDVANAILDGTDAIMLSGETAIGRYPVEALRMMVRIARSTEPALPYDELVARVSAEEAVGITDAITQATCEIAYELRARAILPSTMSGYTARMISRHRPNTPVLVEEYHTTDEMIARAEEAVLETGLAQRGDTVVLTAGIPLGGRGKTNMLKVLIVGQEAPAE